jgi:hyperosmotically inducible periplasmic protein
MRTTIAIIILGALITTAPSAVQSQTTKVESKVEQAKDKTKSATGEAKAAVNDSWITSKTKMALYADERVKGTQVSVATTDGVVRLSGKVDSQEAKAAAADVAKGIEGVKSVRNDLQVVAPGARKAVETSDKDITKAIESRLAKDAQLKKIDVRTDGGVVTLTGEAPTIIAAAKASEQARMTPGVKSVKTEVTVRSANK